MENRRQATHMRLLHLAIWSAEKLNEQLDKTDGG